MNDLWKPWLELAPGTTEHVTVVCDVGAPSQTYDTFSKCDLLISTANDDDAAAFTDADRHTPRTPSQEVNVARRLTPKGASESQMWAARLHLSSDALARLKKSLPILKDVDITSKDRLIIDNDIFRVGSQLKRAPAGTSRGAHEQLEPLQCLNLDGWGHATPSALTGRSYTMEASCRKTGFGFMIDTKNHTHTDWVTWLHTVLAECARYKRVVEAFYVDAGSDLASPAFKELAAAQLKVDVIPAAGGYHEHVAGIEAMNDVWTRMGDAMCQRSERGPSHIIPARMYAKEITNLRCRPNADVTRHEEVTGSPSPVDDIVPYLYGTSVVELEDKQARGPHGSIDRPRAPEGIIVGMRKGSHLVIKANTQEVVARHRVRPLNRQ